MYRRWKGAGVFILTPKNLSEVSRADTFTLISATPPWAPFLDSTSRWSLCGKGFGITWDKPGGIAEGAGPRPAPLQWQQWGTPHPILGPMELQNQGICCCCSWKGDPGWSNWNLEQSQTHLWSRWPLWEAGLGMCSTAPERASRCPWHQKHSRGFSRGCQEPQAFPDSRGNPFGINDQR